MSFEELYIKNIDNIPRKWETVQKYFEKKKEEGFTVERIIELAFQFDKFHKETYDMQITNMWREYYNEDVLNMDVEDFFIEVVLSAEFCVACYEETGGDYDFEKNEEGLIPCDKCCFAGEFGECGTNYSELTELILLVRKIFNIKDKK